MLDNPAVIFETTMWLSTTNAALFYTHDLNKVYVISSLQHISSVMSDMQIF
jgi:hypothetical protein